MPNQTCTICGTVFVLPYRKSNDHPPLERRCPTCGAEFRQREVEPSMRLSLGPLAMIQQQIDKDTELATGVLVSRPPGATKSLSMMTPAEIDADREHNKYLQQTRNRA